MSATGYATIFEGDMDPRDIVDYVSEFDELLESSELIASFLVETTPEAAALGFEISSTFPPSLEPGGQNIIYWVGVNDANQEDLVWCDGGELIPVVITIETSIVPRRYQRTFLIPVRQL
jgi:hypothetical protein